MRVCALAAALIAIGAFSAVYGQQKKVFSCFFLNWAGYRNGNGKFEPGDIDPNECTHLMYGYGVINVALQQFLPSDAWADLSEGGGKGYYRKFNALKTQNPDLKTLLSIGGSTDDSYGLWEMAADPAKRAKVIQSGISFVKLHGFDGVDLSFLFPSSYGGSFAHREDMGLFVTELSTAFRAEGLLVSASVPAVLPPEYEDAYDYHAVLTPGVVDFVGVKTYDIHGAWEIFTHHNSPLYHHPSDEMLELQLSVNSSMWTWAEKAEEQGSDRSLLQLALPTYGRGFQLEFADLTDFFAPVYGPGMIGPYTQTGGYLGYLEICEFKTKYADTYTEKWEPSCQVPYGVWNDFQWYGYDTKESATIKAQYVVDNGFGGVMLYSLEVDDTVDACGDGVNSIGQAVKAVFDAA